MKNTPHPTFEEWYAANKNYYIVKHGNNEETMLAEANESYSQMIGFTGEPKKSTKKKS